MRRRYWLLCAFGVGLFVPLGFGFVDGFVAWLLLFVLVWVAMFCVAGAFFGFFAGGEADERNDAVSPKPGTG